MIKNVKILYRILGITLEKIFYLRSTSIKFKIFEPCLKVLVLDFNFK